MIATVCCCASSVVVLLRRAEVVGFDRQIQYRLGVIRRFPKLSVHLSRSWVMLAQHQLQQQAGIILAVGPQCHMGHLTFGLQPTLLRNAAEPER